MPSVSLGGPVVINITIHLLLLILILLFSHYSWAFLLFGCHAGQLRALAQTPCQKLLLGLHQVCMTAAASTRLLSGC